MSLHVWSPQVCQASDHKPIFPNVQRVSPPQELFLASVMKVEADAPIAMVFNPKHTHTHTSMTRVYVQLPAALPCVFNEQQEVELHYNYLCWQLTGTSCGEPRRNKTGQDCSWGKGEKRVCTCSVQTRLDSVLKALNSHTFCNLSAKKKSSNGLLCCFFSHHFSSFSLISFPLCYSKYSNILSVKKKAVI